MGKECTMEFTQNLKKSVIEYPEDILLTLREGEETFLREMKMLAAVKFYELKKLSLGKAAELAGLAKNDFIKLLSQHKVSIFSLSQDELQKDIENA